MLNQLPKNWDRWSAYTRNKKSVHFSLQFLSGQAISKTGRLRNGYQNCLPNTFSHPAALSCARLQVTELQKSRLSLQCRRPKERIQHARVLMCPWEAPLALYWCCWPWCSLLSADNSCFYSIPALSHCSYRHCSPSHCILPSIWPSRAEGHG